MYYAMEVEYSALRSLENFENERATIRLKCEDSTDPLKALEAAKEMVNSFLGESKVSGDSIPNGTDPIIPEEPQAVSPVIEKR